MVTAGKERWLRAFACVAVLGTGGAAFGQVPGGNPVSNQPPQEITVSLVFRGGTLSEYAAALRAATDGVNILVPEQAGEVHVPPITLKNTTVYAALDALSDLVGGDQMVKVRMIATQPQTAPVYTMAVLRNRPAQMPGMVGAVGPVAHEGRIVRVFSLRLLTEDPMDVFVQKPETILTAIETGLSFSAEAGHPKPLVRYHADSGMLFVQGAPEQVSLVDELLQRMSGDVNRIRQAGPRVREAAPATKEVRTR